METTTINTDKIDSRFDKYSAVFLTADGNDGEPPKNTLINLTAESNERCRTILLVLLTILITAFIILFCFVITSSDSNVLIKFTTIVDNQQKYLSFNNANKQLELSKDATLFTPLLEKSSSGTFYLQMKNSFVDEGLSLTDVSSNRLLFYQYQNSNDSTFKLCSFVSSYLCLSISANELLILSTLNQLDFGIIIV